jgi:hypothetical protein
LPGDKEAAKKLFGGAGASSAGAKEEKKEEEEEDIDLFGSDDEGEFGRCFCWVFFFVGTSV